jgi:hypothetical protein
LKNAIKAIFYFDVFILQATVFVASQMLPISGNTLRKFSKKNELLQKDLIFTHDEKYECINTK